MIEHMLVHINVLNIKFTKGSHWVKAEIMVDQLNIYGTILSVMVEVEWS